MAWDSRKIQPIKFFVKTGLDCRLELHPQDLHLPPHTHSPPPIPCPTVPRWLCLGWKFSWAHRAPAPPAYHGPLFLVHSGQWHPLQICQRRCTRGPTSPWSMQQAQDATCRSLDLWCIETVDCLTKPGSPPGSPRPEALIILDST